MTRYPRRLIAVLLAFTLAMAIGSPAADANPPEWEIETVESLLLADNPSEVPAFIYTAPASVCTNSQGVTEFGDDCPDVQWLCPSGISDGALGRYGRDISYDRAIRGNYGALDTMCIEGAIIPNPQPPESVPAAPPLVIPDPPQLAFTGSDTTTAMLGTALLGAGAALAGIARRRQA